jgi:WD40 repeat protein/DNA-binding XRE family transcriptional regulator
MLTLRTAIGLTQAALAEYLGVSRHAVGEWEAGNSYPKPNHLKQFIALAVKQQAFPVGHEEDDIRSLWRGARQKVLLDEVWLASLLQPSAANAHTYAIKTGEGTSNYSPAATTGSRIEWGDVLAAPTFYGREWELSLLTEWVVEERCHVVSILGLGGIGKSALAVRLMHQLAQRFDVVIWRSVRNAPFCQALIDDCLQVLAPQALGQIPDEPEMPEASEGNARLEQRLGLLLEHLRSKRVLLVLDNLETLLEEGDETGSLRAGYEDYGELLRQVAEAAHQSCLLFTSREKPGDLVLLEGTRSPVRALRLARLDAEACAQLLADANVKGTGLERAQLIDTYTGNPLALKIVAQTVVDLFDGEIAPFLQQETLIFGGVRELLAQQFNRLSPLEQSIMFWLAIMREPVTFDELRAVVVTPVPRVQLLEAVEALRRRSLIERGQQPGSFTLQSVVLEYVTARLVAETSHEIEPGFPAHAREGQVVRLIEHSLTTALAPEYVRQTQERLIVAPVLEHLRVQSASPQPQQSTLEERIKTRLDEFRALMEDAQGYGPANLVALLLQQRGHLRGVDLSGLALRGVYFQGVGMQGSSLAGATIRDCVFTETLDAILSVAVSGDGSYLATCSMQGDVRLWSSSDYTLQRSWRDPSEHTDAFALSPDGTAMAAANWTWILRLWDIRRSALIWSSVPQSGTTTDMLFTADGRVIATTCMDRAVRLWDAQTGRLLRQLQHPEKARRAELRAISCSPDGHWLASGDAEGAIYLWELSGTEEPPLIKSIAEHTQMVNGLAFAPDSRTLASASRDGSVKLWEIPSGRLQATMPGEHGPQRRVAWSPDGRILAFGGQDQVIWLWDVEQGRYRGVLHGHTAMLKGLAFTPDSVAGSERLLSGSDDGTLRLWDVRSGRCIHVIQGYTLAVRSARWSPDGTRLASASSDNVVTIYDVSDLRGANGAGPPPQRLLHGHRRLISGLAWSPDGHRLASSDIDNVIRIWDTASGACLETFGHPSDPNNIFWGLDWSPDGRWLAAGSPQWGVLLWDMQGSRQPGFRQRNGREPGSDKTTPDERLARQWGEGAEGVAWSPDGTRLGVWTSAGNICVWDTQDGVLLQRLVPEYNEITSFAWSPDGRMLAAIGMSAQEAGFFVWDVQSGERVYSVTGSTDSFFTLTWGSHDMIVVGCIDGRLRWWNIASGVCVKVDDGHPGAAVVDLQRSPDGTKVVSCGYDGTIMLWDPQTKEHLQTVRRDRPYERLDITGIRGLTQAQKATLRELGAIERETC